MSLFNIKSGANGVEGARSLEQVVALSFLVSVKCWRGWMGSSCPGAAEWGWGGGGGGGWEGLEGRRVIPAGLASLILSGCRFRRAGWVSAGSLIH